MLVSLLLAFFLLCVGMIVLFIIYVWLLWCSYPRSSSSVIDDHDQKSQTPKGLSELELKKLPCTTAIDDENDLLKGTVCAVCLDEIEIGQPVRLLPGCNNHGFHLQCADAWLSKNPVCPVCRSKLQFPNDHHDDQQRSSPPLTTSPESLC
ncbi:zinc finger protein [Macleaya cordata]|uniref:Zinc finger protein n=1 Tax=Macleaya cordata TaxID=56857 RepID=A0A200QZN0_MACCD|nr:zinc finger protein [Macleaya cordata]